MKNKLYPYPTIQDDIVAKVTSFTVEDRIRTDQIHRDSRTIDLSQIPKAAWQNFSVTIEVTAPLADVNAIEDTGSRVSAIGVLACALTGVRQTFVMERAQDGSTWTGTAEGRRSAFASKATLSSIFTADIYGVPDRIVGYSDEWSVVFDEAAAPQIHGAIRTKWVPFASEEAPAIVKPAVDEPICVDLSEPIPIVYFNSDFPGLYALLSEHRNRSTSEGALYETTLANLAQQVYMALFAAGIAAIVAEQEEEPSWPHVPWKRDVLKEILPLLYPDASDAEQLKLALASRDNPQQAESMQGEILRVVSKHLGASAALRRAIQRLGNVPRSEEEEWTTS